MTYKANKGDETSKQPALQSPVEKPQSGMDNRVKYGLIGLGAAAVIAAALYGGCKGCKPAPTSTPTYTAVPTLTPTPTYAAPTATSTIDAKVQGHKPHATASVHVPNKGKYDVNKAPYDGKKKTVDGQKKITVDVKKKPEAKKSPTALNLEGKIEGVD